MGTFFPDVYAREMVSTEGVKSMGTEWLYLRILLPLGYQTAHIGKGLSSLKVFVAPGLSYYA